MRLTRPIKLYLLYQITFWLLGSLLWLITFGYKNAMSTLIASPHSMLSGTLIFVSTLIATTVVFHFKNRTFLDQPYPYFIFGFYVGNLSLYVLSILDSLIRHLVVWEFPEFFFIFLVSFVELLLSYLFGFAFLAIIPAIASAFILFWIQKFCNDRL